MLNKYDHVGQDWHYVCQKKNNSIKNYSPKNHACTTDVSYSSKTSTQSICIPRVDNSLTRETIYSTFQRINVGNIERITEIPLRNDQYHKRIIIKIRWNQGSELATKIQCLIETTGSFKLIYDMPWYWKIVSTHPQI